VQESNKAAWNGERTRDDADFFTIGYMRRTIDDLIEVLHMAGVGCVVDIRFTPVSMYRPEFSKRNLETRLESEGIWYLHIPDLGVPRDIRGLAAEAGTRQAIWDWYDAEVAGPMIGKNLHSFLNATDGHPMALLCVELDPTACHRHRLALALERRGLRGFDL
jgi:uncharacterized protein (DUF488 family)